MALASATLGVSLGAHLSNGLGTCRDSSQMCQVSLELGGKSPAIVCEDCDIDKAVDETQFALFFNHGQCCCAGSRLYVQVRFESVGLLCMRQSLAV